MNVTDEMVERAARASWDTFGEPSTGMTWDELSDDAHVKRSERAGMRVALEAALGDVESQEDVLGDKDSLEHMLDSGGWTLTWTGRYTDDEEPLWHVEVSRRIGPDVEDDRFGTGTTIAGAVANAKGGE